MQEALIMTIYLILLTLAAYAEEAKIVGGIEVDIVDFPYQVALEYGRKIWCGGTIISSNKVLTAAHCLDYEEYSDYFFVRGASDTVANNGQVMKVADVSIHPLYDESTYDYDIGVLTLKKHFNFNDVCKPAALSKKRGFGNRTCWVSGWGSFGNYSYPKKLLAVSVNEMPNPECHERNKHLLNVTDRMICFGILGEAKDACRGDSGGPLFDQVAGELVGVVSWGPDCTKKDGIGVYTRVSVVYDWIMNQINTKRAQHNVVKGSAKSSATKLNFFFTFFD